MDNINITLDDLGTEQRQLAELIGLDNFIKLIDTYGGCSIYIPKTDNFQKSTRNEEIRAKFDGYNFRELAQEYNLTEVRIRAIVYDIQKEVRSRPGEGQLSLFEQ